MPLISNGPFKDAYADDNESKPYEAESAYYLNFQIISALASLHHLTVFDDSYKWENRCQYYHFYTDHLLYSLGQIANRFVIVEKDNNKKRALYLERKKYNRINYQFTESEYPILSNKQARNVIEHIDEYNEDIIRDKLGVGGFNLIDAETDEKLNKLLRERDQHPYTLDLLTHELYIRYKEDDITIDLIQLKNELTSLLANVRSFSGYLTEDF